MAKKTNWLLWGGIAFGAYILIKNKQPQPQPGALVSTGTAPGPVITSLTAAVQNLLGTGPVNPVLTIAPAPGNTISVPSGSGGANPAIVVNPPFSTGDIVMQTKSSDLALGAGGVSIHEGGPYGKLIAVPDDALYMQFQHGNYPGGFGSGNLHPYDRITGIREGGGM